MLHGGLEEREWWEGDHYAHLCILQEYISLILIGFPISSRRLGFGFARDIVRPAGG